MASPPSTKRRRTSSSSSPLPPPLDLAAVDTAIRTPRQPPSRRHRPATHPCYHRCPSRPQHPDGAVLIDLAIGLRSPPPPSASAAASARRETRPQIARRHPAPRIVYDGDKDRKDEEATEGGLEAEKREEGEREGREAGKRETEQREKIPRAHPLATHECIDAHADGQALATPRCLHGHPTAHGTLRHPQARYENVRASAAARNIGRQHARDVEYHPACAEQEHEHEHEAFATRRWRRAKRAGRAVRGEAGIEEDEKREGRDTVLPPPTAPPRACRRPRRTGRGRRAQRAAAPRTSSASTLRTKGVATPVRSSSVHARARDERKGVQQRDGGVDGEGSGEEADDAVGAGVGGGGGGGGGVREAVSPSPPELVRPRQRRDRGKGGRLPGLCFDGVDAVRARENSDGILRPSPGGESSGLPVLDLLVVGVASCFPLSELEDGNVPSSINLRCRVIRSSHPFPFPHPTSMRASFQSCAAATPSKRTTTLLLPV
ncbi:hypothetical protein DFH09DRAFT_1505117 [Mycena vulgaris]|nr:hypothetical protein DFH09DRAFT_1505117 [Mycena vulgaris]